MTNIWNNVIFEMTNSLILEKQLNVRLGLLKS